MPTEFEIDDAEAAELAEVALLAIQTEAPDARQQIIASAILKLGARFVLGLRVGVEDGPPEHREALERLYAEAMNVMARWLAGEKLSDRVDEDERRARAALDVLELDPMAALIANRTLNRLPGAHPFRQEGPGTDALEGQLALFKEEGNLDLIVGGIVALLRNDEVSKARRRELFEEAVALGQNEAVALDARQYILRAAMTWHFRCGITVSPDPTVPIDGDERAAFLNTTDELARLMRGLGTSPGDELAIGVALARVDVLDQAAETLAPVADAGGEFWRIAASLEAQIRIKLGNDLRATVLLERVVGPAEDEYILALESAPIAQAGSHFAVDTSSLALAYARQSRWSDAHATIERSKSARLRHLAKLRASDAGRALLDAEAKVALLRRGVPAPAAATPETATVDPLSRDLTAEIRALEAYRTRRPDLSRTSIEPPGIDTTGALLTEGEGLVSIGVDKTGLMMVGIVRGDETEPSWTEHRPQLTYKEVMGLFLDGEGPLSGWLLELASRAPMQPKRSLQRLLANVDGALGTSLALFASTHGLKKLTIVPHRILHAIPYWALPSLSHLDVQVAPSTAHWSAWRARIPRLEKKAVVVGNPTLDLDFASAEATCVASVLRGLGYGCDTFIEEFATEQRVRDAMKNSSLLHYAGHAFSRTTEPLLCSLVMHPATPWPSSSGDDPLRALAEGVEVWSPIVSGVRHADTPSGRLVERYDDPTSGLPVERQLDYAMFGTLWGGYFENRLLRLAELWTTSDMLIDDSLGRCALAFLCACESGRADLSVEIDEAVSIPSSLEIGGVSTVICTLWLVADIAALIFARLFYAELSAATGSLDARAVVKSCRERLRGMDANEVLDLLATMRAEATDPVTAAQIKAAEREVMTMPDTPFADPIHWAAFTCYGAERIGLPEG